MSMTPTAIAIALFAITGAAVAKDTPEISNVAAGSWQEVPEWEGRGEAETRQFGHYTLVDGEPYAVEGETWTFDHGSPDPLEGWRVLDLSAGEAANAFRRITPGEWSTHNPGVTPPIPEGNGAAWVGYFQDEATSEGWVGGLGYGTNWIQRYTSPTLTYEGPGAGSVSLAFDYFNDTEPDYDYTHVSLILDSGTEIGIASFTGQVGDPSSSSFAHFSTTLTSSDFENQEQDFWIVFEMESDGSYDDQDGNFDTAFGAFGFDNLELTDHIVQGDQAWDFEADDHGFVSSQPTVGTFFGVETFDDPLECNLLSDQVAEFHSDALSHPQGQHEMAYSPAVQLDTIADPDSIYAQVALYSHLAQSEGVYFRIGWQFYPASEGSDEWSERVGFPNWFYTGSDPVCYVLSSDGTAYIPTDAEQVRLTFEVSTQAECTDPACGNSSPLVDDLVIFVRGIHTPTSVSDQDVPALAFRNQFAAPNPTTGAVTLKMSTAEAGTLSGAVFAADGRRVRLLERRDVGAGVHDVVWNGLTNDGLPTPAGVYLVRLGLDVSDGRSAQSAVRVVRVSGP